MLSVHAETFVTSVVYVYVHELSLCLTCSNPIYQLVNILNKQIFIGVVAKMTK